jgi:MFS family permease
VLAACFIAAGVGIACAETAETAAVATLAPTGIRGSAFGLLATVPSLGNFVASGIAGILWTTVGPGVAFLYAAAWTALALLLLLIARR